MKTLTEKEIRILARRLNQIYDLQTAKRLSRKEQVEMYQELLLVYSNYFGLHLDSHDISCFLAENLPRIDKFSADPAA
ncbi:hypothetical protein [Emergencia sp.]|uniref:hypothetical protein n=1 Tax=Emergencia sp. TaxID=1926557 RepID=UPI003AEF321F